MYLSNSLFFFFLNQSLWDTVRPHVESRLVFGSLKFELEFFYCALRRRSPVVLEGSITVSVGKDRWRRNRKVKYDY